MLEDKLKIVEDKEEKDQMVKESCDELCSMLERKDYNSEIAKIKGEKRKDM